MGAHSLSAIFANNTYVGETLFRSSGEGRSRLSNVATLPRKRIIVNHSTSRWNQAATERMNELVQLPVGWDGYRAGPVNLNTVIFAMNLLENVCPPDAAIPQIVPGIVGDLQIEWHLPGLSIELHVQAPNQVHAWCSNDMGVEVETLLINDFTDVSRWLHSNPGAVVGSRSASS